MATKQSKGKLKNQKPPNLPKEKKVKGYIVLQRVWIRKVHRFPGYILTAEDISALKLKKGFDLNIKRKVIKAF